MKREKELNRKIFTFFVSHDHKSIRIYDYYLVIKKDNIIFYRHSIHTFDFTILNDKKKVNYLQICQKRLRSLLFEIS